MSKYDAVATRASQTIGKKGGIVTFLGNGTTPIFDPLTGLFSGGVPEDGVEGKALQIEGDPDRLNKLTLVNPVTLMVAAATLAITPTNGMQFSWGGVTYSIKDLDSVNPDGAVRPILWIITGTT